MDAPADSAIALMGRPIHFPDLNAFSDFFPEVGPENPGPLLTIPSWEAGSWSDRRAETTFEVGAFIWIKGRNQKHLTTYLQKLPPFIEKFAREEMLHTSNDRTSFEVIQWANGHALVLIQYGQILGSRYLGIIDASTIPEAP
jgi:hypothetical protein